jgi:DNA-binding NtrC family response regulator
MKETEGMRRETENRRVLLVDDEPNVLMATVRSLRALGFDFYTARDAAEAMKIIEEEHVDIAIVDERMPGMRGTQLLGWIADVKPGTVRIMLTGEKDDATFLRAALEARIDRFLTKPVPRDVLLAAIEEALRKHSLSTYDGNESSSKNEVSRVSLG